VGRKRLTRRKWVWLEIKEGPRTIGHQEIYLGTYKLKIKIKK